MPIPSAATCSWRLEQLEAIRDLLHSNSPVKARMALILLDGLADAMLFRRLQQLYEAAEEPILKHKMPRFSTRERNLARQRFNKRVEIARRPTELDGWLGDGEPLISDADAIVLKVGHSYRNDAYHEDAHNAFVVPSVLVGHRNAHIIGDADGRSAHSGAE